MLRRLSLQNQITARIVECLPQDGEQTRFGVYFHALRTLNEDRSHLCAPCVIVPTEELLFEGGVDVRFVQKGVLVFPSSVYQTEAERLERKRLSPYEIDAELNHSWMTLDLAAEQRDAYPIFSIPCQVRIHSSRLIDPR